MAIPTVEGFMAPLLAYYDKQSELVHLNTSYEAIADKVGLTIEERNKWYDSGNGVVYIDRIKWAASFLRMAKLIESPIKRKAIFQITPEGREFLHKLSPDELTKLVYKRHEERPKPNGNLDKKTSSPDSPPVETSSPTELLERGYSLLQQTLQQQLIERLATCDPTFFEQLVVDLLVKMGYGGSLKDAGQALGRSGDGGVDGIIKADALGLDVVYIQAKRWQGNVGEPPMRDFYGALGKVKASKGVFITTSDFLTTAVDYAKHSDKRIILINGAYLTRLMIEHNIGVTQKHVYITKEVDNDFFAEDEV